MKLAILKALPQIIGGVLLLLSLSVLVAILRTSPLNRDAVAHVLVGFALLTALIGAILGVTGLALQARAGKTSKLLAKGYGLGGGVYLFFSAAIAVANWSIGAQ